MTYLWMKIKFKEISMRILCTILLFFSLLKGQIVNPEITEKVSFVVLPSSIEEQLDPTSIGYQVVELVAGEASKIDRYKIYNRQDLEKVLQEQALYQSGLVSDDQMIEFGKIVQVKEVMAVTVTEFIEREIVVHEEFNSKLGAFSPFDKDGNIKEFMDHSPEERRESLEEFKKEVGRKNDLKEKSMEELKLIYNLNRMSNEEDFKDFTEIEKQKFIKQELQHIIDASNPNRWVTNLYFTVKIFNVETSEILNTFDVEAMGYDPNKEIARQNAFYNARELVSSDLRSLYKLTTVVLEVNNDDLVLVLGEDLGVKKGTIFQISSPEQERDFQGKKIIFPGEAVGLARVEQVGTSANRSRVIRRWNEIKPGYLAEEKMQFGGSSYLGFLMNTKDISFMPAFFMNPYSEDWKYSERIEVKAAIQLGMVKDTRNKWGFYLGAPVLLGTWKVIQTPEYDFGMTTNFYPNFMFREDDEGNSILGVRFKYSMGIEAIIVNSPTKDLVIGIDITPGEHFWGWSNSKAEENAPNNGVVWNEGSITPDYSTPRISLRIGYRFTNFVSDLTQRKLGDYDEMLGRQLMDPNSALNKINKEK